MLLDGLLHDQLSLLHQLGVGPRHHGPDGDGGLVCVLVWDLAENLLTGLVGVVVIGVVPLPLLQ